MLIGRFLGVALTLDQERLLWLAGSVLLYVAVTNAVWALRPTLQRISWSPTASIITAAGRFAYYVGIPYVALLGGGVTLASLGLVPAPSEEALNHGALAAVGAIVVVGLIGWHYWREVVALHGGGRSSYAEVQQNDRRHRNWVSALLTVVNQQVHWAFYRAVPVLVLADPYAGAFLGLGLVLLEAYANPRVRQDLTDPVKAESLLLSAGFAVVTTVLFALTGTSWLGAGVHLAVVGWIVFVRARRKLQPL